MFWIIFRHYRFSGSSNLNDPWVIHANTHLEYLSGKTQDESAGSIVLITKMPKEIYLDNAATTKVDSIVLEAMLPFFDKDYGNASSLHEMGQIAAEAIEKSRQTIAQSISASPEEIVFTSGGTESNNFAIKGIAFANKDKGKHIITTKIEHKSVLNTCKWLESQGFEISILGVDEKGFVKIEDLEKAIRPETILVSIIHGQNEIGTIQSLEELGAVCKKHNVYFHIDACQSYTKVPIDVRKQNLDLVTLNAHKINGPKGVGVLYVRRGTKIGVLIHGGNQESGMRSGTENIAGIVGFAKAVKIASWKNVAKMTRIRDKFIEEVLKIPHSKLNGPTGDKRLCNNLNFSFRAIEGESIGAYLDVNGICSSNGSACSSHKLETSHVLLAIGVEPLDANGSIRLSLDKNNSEGEVDYVVKVLGKTVSKLRKISPFKL